MTYCTYELRARGVSEPVLAFRRWRRDMRLTQAEAAAMAEVCFVTLARAERGETKPHGRTLDKLRALMERWRGHGPFRPRDRRGKKAGAAIA